MKDKTKKMVKAKDKTLSINKDFHYYIAVKAKEEQLTIKDFLELAVISFSIEKYSEELQEKLLKIAKAENTSRPSVFGNTFEERLLATALNVYTSSTELDQFCEEPDDALCSECNKIDECPHFIDEED